MAEKMTHSARYLYPGAFMPEDISRDLEEPTFQEAIRAQADDGWYAVEITSTTWKLFTADDGETEWVAKNRQKVGSWIVGEKIHYTEIEDTDDNRILRSNLRNNDKDGFGVKTRRGNWQPADAYDHVVPA
jgi:hypothetical protein